MLYSHDKYRAARKLLLIVIGIVTIIPLAPLINRYIPPLMVGKWNLDLAFSILLAAVSTYLILRLFHFLMIPALLLFAGVLFYNQFTDGYGFKRMINDYRSMVVDNWGKKEQKEIDLVLTPSFFDGPLTKTVKSLQSKVNHKDSIVRNFAVANSLLYFDEYHNKYGSLVRVLSLFKHINSTFKYVSDSERDEYFATAKETIRNGMGGDCDDHTILMVSALKAIGAHCRMVLTEGHLYPELLCGDEKAFELMQSAIILLFGKEAIGNIYYHEQNGNYWINLDYSARYPGGPYVSEKAYALIDLK
ncbi:MAG: transglutaminase domain-containing protein [Chitinophagaceae bacterium]|nr:transglutaminase domain-containing protein [Chitinophagaceae bacterium]